MELEYDFFKVEEGFMVPKKGRILISEPFLNDTYFKRSIVFLTEHNDEGSVGFVLNKPVDMKVHEVIQDFPEIDAVICIGGPVNTNTIHYIHTLGDIIPNSIHVVGDIYWGGDFDTVKKLTTIGKLSSNNIRFFLGYSGWNPNQLTEELERNSWVVTDIEPSRIMSVRNGSFWKEVLNNVGNKYALWPNFPEDPQFN